MVAIPYMVTIDEVSYRPDQALAEREHLGLALDHIKVLPGGDWKGEVVPIHDTEEQDAGNFDDANDDDEFTVRGGMSQGRKNHDSHVTGFDAIFSTGFFATFSRFCGARLSKLHINTGEKAKNPVESLQWRRRPEIADFCPLSWSNLS